MVELALLAVAATIGVGAFLVGNALAARWSTDWLDWERRQDAEHRARREAVEAELERATDETAPPLRTRLEALEREKLEQYQRRYEEYVHVSRALKELSETEPETNRRSTRRGA